MRMISSLPLVCCSIGVATAFVPPRMSLAVVTGGGTGIGAAISKELAKHGCKVVVNYPPVEKQREPAEKVAQEIRDEGGEAEAIEADVSSPDAMECLISTSLQKFKCDDLDVLVNNAGILQDTGALDMTQKQWETVIDINLSGVFYCSQAAAKHMVKQGHGRIVNIASMIGQQGNVNQANYAAAKGGVLGMTRAMAREFADRGLSINSVCPGYIETAMTEQHDRECLEGRIPMKRLGKAEEVAALVRFLALDAGGAYITGHSIYSDGGIAIGAT